MWRSIKVFSQSSRKIIFHNNYISIRKYLSSAFNCEESWNRRLQSPLIKKIHVSNMFYELENQFIRFGKANSIDIDLFANSVTDDSHIDELEDVIHKLRLSTEATSLLPSTQHAFIRMMMSFGSIDELIRVLDDRFNYGIFLDDYSCILLMNKCIVEQNFKNASKIAVINMLQEDLSNPIVQNMTLFSCHKYLLNPSLWDSEPEETNNEKTDQDEDEDEIIKLRVSYIRNPYFDDHFDLKEPNHLIGKTFWMIGKEIKNSIGRSYELIGYILHGKWDKFKHLLNHLLQSNEKDVIYRDSISLIRKGIDDSLNNNAENKDFETNKDEIINLLSKLEDSNLLCNDSLIEAVENEMKMSITQLENQMIENQKQLYEDWEKQRSDLVNKHIEKLKRDQVLGEIKSVKEELEEKEKELFFFENENKLDLMIDKKRVRYPKKWLGKKKPKRVVDSEYIPPEVEKRRTN